MSPVEIKYEFLLLPPKTIQAIVPVIKAIPDDWTYVEGGLHLSTNKKAIANLRCLVGDADPAMTTWSAEPPSSKPNLTAWLAKGGAPEFIDISYPGQYGSRPTGYMSRMKSLILALIAQGYYPNLQFFRDAKGQEWNGAECRLSTFKGTELTLIIKPHEGGTEACVAPIIQACLTGGWVKANKRH